MGRIKQSLFRKKRKKESWFKYLMAILHIWLGLLSALIVFIVAFSGSIYAYKQQVVDFVNREAAFVEPQNVIISSVDDLLAHFESNYGTATAIQVFDDDNRSFVITSMTKGNVGITVYYNPYTGEQCGLQKQGWNTFFETMLNLHRFLLLGDTGKLINGIAILIFVFLLISGLVLWIPMSIAKLKDSLRVEWRTTFYRLIYDLHNTLGFYTTILLLCIALTGLYTSFHWMKNLMIVGLGGHSIVISEDNLELQKDLSDAFKTALNNLEEETDKPTEKPMSLQAIVDESNGLLTNKGQTTILLPNEHVKTIKATKINFDTFMETPDVIEFSASGQIRTIKLFKDLPFHEKFKSIVKPMHTGELFGLPGIIIFSLASFIACSLPVTGVVLWLKKM
ncbi:MAG: PepSY domain-containing protein [Carboxylicivirga sp.]|nr:PepSY domain-containing protein [Carboxylicivirga sp.]